MNDVERSSTASQTSSQNKKINAYLDGSLTQSERAEFEAYVRTHPEFEVQIKAKKLELEQLMALMPNFPLSQERFDSIQREVKISVYNLLKEEPRNFVERMKTLFSR